MDSKNYTWEEEMYWNYFHFARFSLFLPHDFHHGLMLPKKFTEHMRTQLPESMVLKVNGISWKVNLVKGKDDVMFQGDGWQEFVKAYSLKKSDMLMFNYDKLEGFEVLLFDEASLCEKEASYFVRKGKQSNSNDRDQSSGEAQETVAEELNYRNQRVNGSAYAFRNQRIKNYEEKGYEHDETSNEENVNSDKKCTTQTIAYAKRAREVPSNSRKRKHELDEETTRRRKRSRLTTYKSNRRPVTEEEKEKALEKARETCARYLDSFIVIMRPSSVYSRFYMSIPSEWKMGLFFKKGQEVILNMKEKTWVCKVGISGHQKGFDRGWKNFVSANKLEEFDVCLFVPTGSKDGRTVLDVSIFRVVSDVVPPTPITPDVLEISSRDTSQGNDVSDCAQKNKYRMNSGFTSNSHFSGRATHNRDLNEVNCDGSSDDDKSITEEDGIVKAANAIEVPFKSQWKNGNSTPKENEVYGKSNARQRTQADKERILEIAQAAAAKQKNSFIQIMKPSTVNFHYFMTIPKYWNQSCNLKNDEEVILKFKEKTWVCNFCSSPSNTGLRKGWKGFVCDNKLEEFDICMFVPTEPMNGKLVLDVRIFRVRQDRV